MRRPELCLSPMAGGSRLTLPLALLLAPWVAHPAAAAGSWGGKLPQGEITEADSLMPIKKETYSPKSCFDDFGTAPYQKVPVDSAGDKLYYLDQGPVVDQLMDKVLPFDAKKTKESTKEVAPPHFQYRRSVLYEINFRTWKGKRLAYMEVPDADQILVTGRPANTVYTLSFHGGGACGRGPATLFGLNFNLPLYDREVRFLGGEFSALRVESGALIFDNLASYAYELAKGRFQVRRSLFPIPKDEIPLYASQGINMIETWQTGDGSVGSPRGLKIYRKGSVVEAKVRFTPGDKLVRDGARSAVLSLDPAANQMTILEVKRLSNVREPASFSFKLPENLRVADAKLELDMKFRLAWAIGSTPIIQRQWKKAVLLDYKNGTILTQFQPADGFEIDTVLFDPSGATAMVIERDKARTLGSRLNAYSLKSRSWRIVDLSMVK